jgi:hypothetical protein
VHSVALKAGIAWLQPYETRTFSQYWYPIQKIGPAKNANPEAAVNLEFEEGIARVAVSVTSPRTVRVVLTQNGNLLLDEQGTIAPERTLIKDVGTDSTRPEKHQLLVQDSEGRELIAYRPEKPTSCELPDPAVEPLEPAPESSLCS